MGTSLGPPSCVVAVSLLTEMGRFIWITLRNHSSLQIQAARLAHIRSSALYLPVGDTILACLTDCLSSPSGTVTRWGRTVVVRVAMLLCEHHHKLVYNTFSAPLYPAASLSGAAASTQQRSAPRLETSAAHLTKMY